MEDKKNTELEEDIAKETELEVTEELISDDTKEADSDTGETDEGEECDDTLPIESFSMKYSEEELRALHKKQRKPLLSSLIAFTVLTAIIIAVQIISPLDPILFGIMIGAFSMIILMVATNLIIFSKGSKASVSTTSDKEVIFTIFKDDIKIESFESGVRTAEEFKKHSLLPVSDTGEDLVVTVFGRSYAIKKRELCEESYVHTAFKKQIENDKKAKKRDIILKITLIACACLIIVFSLLGELGELSTNAAFQERIESLVDESFDGYEFLTCFNVQNGIKQADTLCLISSGSGIDVMSYRMIDGEETLVKIYSGITPDMRNVRATLRNDSAVILRIYQNEADIPDSVSHIQEFRYNDKTMYFCLTFSK